MQTMNSVVHLVEAGLTVSTTVVGVDMGEAATMTIIVDLLVMTTVNVVHTVVVMIMALVALIAMLHQAATTAIVAVERTAVVETNTMVEMVDVRAITLLMATLCSQGTIGIHMVEVEPLTIALMIGTPVDRLRSAKSTQVRSALPNNAPKPASCSRAQDRRRLGLKTKCFQISFSSAHVLQQILSSFFSCCYRFTAQGAWLKGP